METTGTQTETLPRLSTLPGDDVRQLMWRFPDRYDLQMLVQSSRSVARGPVARLVAEGARHGHDWTEQKNELLEAFDGAGITGAFLDMEYGGFIEGPKNLALALIAFELAWVDAGAATGALAGDLALSPIHERGTDEQKREYMSRCAPARPGEDRKTLRGAFALTEPLPYVGVDTGVLGGKVTVVDWPEGGEPTLKVEKRGRFITNMAFAEFVTAAVESNDPRIKGSCIIILEKTDDGLFDPGTPTKKLVHQLSSTQDPVFSMTVPASRIVGGYEVTDGVIVPKYSHSAVIEAVFRRTRVTVGLMTAAKLLSAVEPVIRYQRGRFRGGEAGKPGTPRHDLGLQMKEDVLLRLADVWATGEAAASMGFASARLFDQFDPIEKAKDAFIEAEGLSGRALFKVMKSKQADALEYLALQELPVGERDASRYEELESDPLVAFMATDALAGVLCPATKLWNTGHGATVMREAVSLMGGYGITEDCPGFLGQKWMDAQLEATYEGPEAVQRRQLSVTMTSPVFLAHFDRMKREMRKIASVQPGTGACTVASAMEIWRWTLDRLIGGKDADGKPLYKDQRQGVTFPMADALCWILASYHQIQDVIELARAGRDHPTVGPALDGYVQFFTDLCHAQAASAGGEVGRICAELVFGYDRHPSWKDDGPTKLWTDEDVDALENFMPGMAAGAGGCGEVIRADGEHAVKAGPCACMKGKESFNRLRSRLDGCMTGARLAKDRAAKSLVEVMIPEALDYPL